MKTEVPAEVRENVKWSAGREVPADQIHWALKSEFTRGEAWDQIRPRDGKMRNPWRKAHSEHYWAWWRKGGQHKGPLATIDFLTPKLSPA